MSEKELRETRNKFLKKPFYKDKRYWWGFLWGATLGRGLIVLITMLGVLAMVGLGIIAIPQ